MCLRSQPLGDSTEIIQEVSDRPVGPHAGTGWTPEDCDGE